MSIRRTYKRRYTDSRRHLFLRRREQLSAHRTTEHPQDLLNSLQTMPERQLFPVVNDNIRNFLLFKRNFLTFINLHDKSAAYPDMVEPPAIL